MLVAVLQIAWFSWFFAALGAERRWAPRSITPLEAALIATAVVGAFEFLIPVALSPFTAFSVPWVTLVWLAVASLSGVLGLRSVPRGARSALRSLRTTWRAVRADRVTTVWAASIGMLLIGTMASALLYPPTIWDSHAYHLPTALQYVQNHTVDPFPTYYAPMANTYPAAMYTLAQVMLLSGGDQLLNMVQWFSYVLIGATVFGLARKLGAGPRGAQFATLIALAAPTVATQASTTQHDLIVAMWALTATYLAIRLMQVRQWGHGTFWAVILGLAVGVGAVTKITFVVGFAPFAVILLARLVHRHNWHVTMLWVLAGVVGAAVSSPFFGHNLLHHGDLLGTRMAGNVGLSVTDLSAGALWANLWRNLALTMATPIGSINRLIESVIRAIGGALGTPVDAPVNLAGSDVTFSLSPLVNSPEWSGATLTWVLIAIATIYALFRGRTTVRAYLFGGLGSLLALTLLLSYQPWAVRFHMAPLLLLCPAVGAMLTTFGRRAGWPARRGLPARPGARRSQVMAFALATVALALGGLAVTFHITQPLLPISVLTRGDLTSRGWWDTRYHERALATSLPFMAPEHRALDQISRDVLREWQGETVYGQKHDHPTVLYGGSITDATPNYVLMEHCARIGFAVILQGPFGADSVPGHLATESNEAHRDIVVAYHTDRNEPQVADCDGRPISMSEGYTKVYERPVPELGGWATIWVWNTYR